MEADDDRYSPFSILIRPVGAQRFFREFWEHSVLYLPPRSEVIKAVAGSLPPLEIRSLVGRAKGGTQAWIKSDSFGHVSIPVDEDSAEGSFRIGATLYFFDLHCRLLTESCARFLGVPDHKLRISVFATPKGGGAPCHFDANENFTLQLSGIKRWNIASNSAVRSPPANHVLGAETSSTLAACLRQPLPATAPSPMTTFDLEPAAVLYVPRGHWHVTQALTESWSLNISYGDAMWVDVLCEALHANLIRSERWRQTAVGFLDGSDIHARAASSLSSLLAELSEVLRTPTCAEDLMSIFQPQNQPRDTQ